MCVRIMCVGHEWLLRASLLNSPILCIYQQLPPLVPAIISIEVCYASSVRMNIVSLLKQY